MPYSLGAPGCSGHSRGEPAWLPAGPLGLCPDLLGWGSGFREYPAGGNLGGVSRAARGHRGAPRARLRPRAAAGHGPAVSWGLILGLARQLGGAIRDRRLAGDSTCQPMLNVALGIPRGLVLGPGLVGSLAGRPAWGSLCLGRHRLPRFACTDRSPRQASGLRAAGPQSQKGADVLGLPVLSTFVGTSPSVLLPRNVWIRVSCIRSGPAMGVVLGRAGWPGGIMCNGFLGSGGGILLLGLGGGRTRRHRHTGIQDELVAREPGPRGFRARSRRMLRKGVDFPSREGTSRQGISDGLGCCLASWRPRTSLCAEVAETYIVESAPHAEPSAVVLGGVVPDGLVATLPLAPPSGLVRFVPFELGFAWTGGPPRPQRPEHGKYLSAYLALLWFATLAQVMHV